MTAESRTAGRLENQVALIIGAARGIGRGIAERFREEGAKLVLADSEAEAGTATAGTAPLKFTSGIVLGTTEAGTIEFNNEYISSWR